MIACNSASAAAFEAVRTHVGHRALVMNVIQPVIDALDGHLNPPDLPHPKIKLGLIGTRQTIHSNIYQRKISTRYPGTEVIPHATNLLAAAIEEFGAHEVTDTLLAAYLADPLMAEIDALILACTHYPVIKHRINEFFAARNRTVTVMTHQKLSLQPCNLFWKNINSVTHKATDKNISMFQITRQALLRAQNVFF